MSRSTLLHTLLIAIALIAFSVAACDADARSKFSIPYKPAISISNRPAPSFGDPAGGVGGKCDKEGQVAYAEDRFGNPILLICVCTNSNRWSRVCRWWLW